MITKMRRINAAGFSLVELMVVVAIIGILASVAIPNFQRFQRKARQGEAKTLLSGIVTAEEALRAEWESYASDLSAAGFGPTGQLRYHAGIGAGLLLTLAANGYTGTPMVAGNNDTTSAQVCVAANCMATANACAPAGTAITATTFVAAACGMIGGMVSDQWTLNQAKLLANTADGIP